MSVYRCFTKTRRRVDEVISVFEECSKHPADVPFKDSTRALLDKQACPEVPCAPYLKSACALFEHSSNAIYNMSSLRLKQFAKTPVTDISPQHKNRSRRESTEHQCGKTGAKMYGSQGWQIVVE